MVSLTLDLKERAQTIGLLCTDCDGVLTDAGVYYGENGEELKKFSIRDGMGVERLRKLCGIETGIISGERSPSLRTRAEKLNIQELHLGIKEKRERIAGVLKTHNLNWSEMAYIGDDVNDLELIEHAGLTATPSDGMSMVQEKADYICSLPGGHGAFREFAELIIKLRDV